MEPDAHDQASPQDLAAERIRELERTLLMAVDYLRRLPPVPTTVSKAAEFEAVARAPARIRERSCTTTRYAVNGFPLISAEFIGNWLYLKAPVRTDEDAIQANLIGYLRKGVRLECVRRPEYSQFSELELAYWEANPR